MSKPHLYVDPGQLTPADAMRARMSRLSELVGQLGHTVGCAALEVPSLVDEVDEALDKLQAQGLDVRGERSQLEAALGELDGKLRVFLREVGGANALEAARRRRQAELAGQIDPARWWWFPERVLAERRRAMVRRLWQGAALVAAVLAVLYGVYQRFLAPSPEVTAAFAHRQKSEQALEQNDLNAALREVETAIAAMPAEADQWVLKGVIQSLLGQGQAAGETFAAAEAKLGSRSALLVSRGQRWLLAGRFDAALADAQAAIALDPDSIVGHLVLGQAFERTQQEWKAITAYEQAAKLADAQNQPQLAVMARMQMGMIQQRPILPTPKP